MEPYWRSRTQRCHSRESGNPVLRSIAGGYWIACFRACETIGPHPEERALARVSKDGCTARTRCHPSRRALKGAPQDEVLYFFTRSFAAMTRPCDFIRPKYAVGVGTERYRKKPPKNELGVLNGSGMREA